LIGYYFNEHILPWDDDIDLQMTYADLVNLIKFNNTIIGKDFLIDVNPNMKYRVKMQENTIDARIIDTLTGAFIDITGLATIDKTFSGITLYSCKSPHYYAYADLFPLHRAKFEGVHTWRPNDVDKILATEYGSQVLTKHNFKNFKWNGTVWLEDTS